MALLNRYARTQVLEFGKRYGTSFAIPVIRSAIKNNLVRTTQTVLEEAERLDILAGKFYGDGRLFWILAAASDIGWSLQVPPGTIIYVPNLDDVAKVTG